MACDYIAHLKECVKNKRAQLLSDSDWVVTKAIEKNTEIPEAWVTYRQALRDITLREDYPTIKAKNWPSKPE